MLSMSGFGEMRRKTDSCIGLAWIVVLFQTGCASSNQTIEVNHAEKTAVVVGGDGKKFSSGDVIDLDGNEVLVKVVSTETAFYEYSLAEEKAESRDFSDLSSFLTAWRPYAVDAPLLGYAAPHEADIAAAPYRQGEEPLSAFESLLAASDAARPVFQSIVHDIEKIRGLRDAAVSKAVHLARSMPVDPAVDSGLSRISVSDSTLSEVNLIAANLARLDPLASSMTKLRKEIRTDTLSDDQKKELAAADSLIAGVQKLLDSRESVIEAAHQAEDLILAVVKSKKTYDEFELVGVSLRTDRLITVTATKRPIPPLSSIAPFEKLEFNARLHRRWTLKPSVGLSLLYSEGAVFDELSVRDSAGQKVVTDSGDEDYQYNWGLVLGLGYDRLDWKASPEVQFMVSPSDKIRAVGVSAGLRFWDVVVLSVGEQLVRHKVYNHPAGTILGAGGTLSSENKYSGRLFIGLSLHGVPPFVAD